MKVEADSREAPAAGPLSPTPSNTESPVSSLDDCRVTDGEQIPTPDKALLAKLEEENRRIEADAKSASLTNVHSRKNSDTSQISLASATSSNQEETRVAGSNGEEDLWGLWGRIVSNWETEWKRRNQFVRDLVRQGVPHHFRGIVWQLLAGVDSSPEKKHYASYIKAKSACEKVIRRDIARTYPEHDFFKEKNGLGQESLFNVMKAYSLHDREVGYCQGSGFIVGLLLMQMPEEEAFAVLVKIMQQHRMRDMFKPSMAELGLCMFQLENLVQELLPELHVHFQSQSFSTSIYASSWFLTLFTTTLSLPLACRIMDVFLSEGIEIVFKVALAMLTLGKNDLLSLDMESILKYIQKELPVKAEADQDAFMNLAYSIKVNPKKMKKLEKEYTVIKTKEQGDIAVLRCLRQENRLLKQRVELLENESSALAERLVRGQVDRAEGEEETFALAREVQALRRANVDVQQRLAVAQDEIRSLEMTIAENNSRQSSLEGVEGGAKGEELARCLQRELVRARLHAAEREAAERELTARIAELENENKSLRRQRVDNNVAHLQDELIAVKLREAEANLSLKDLRQRVSELSDAWQRHLQEHRQEATPPPAQSTNVVSDIMATPKKLLRAWEGRSTDMMKLDEELMTTRIREVEALTELKELRLKVMELETQVQVSTNQLRRQDEEARQLRETLDAALLRERTLQGRQREFQHKYADLESKAKYDSMQANIRNMEDAQRIAELETEVSEYKLKNEVMATEGELRSNMDDSDRVRELQEQVAELKAENHLIHHQSSIMTTASVLMTVTTTWGSMSEKLEKDKEKGRPRSVAEVAAQEIRESPATREQALRIMREWIQKNSDIRNVRTDDAFLLRFLRQKKYSIPMAQQTLLKYLNLKKFYLEYFSNLDCEDPRIEEIISNGYIVVSPVRDVNGRRVIIYTMSKFDAHKFNCWDMCRAHMVVYESLLDDPTDQVCGFTHVGDGSGVSAAHVTTWNPSDFARLIKWGEQSIPMRHKEFHIVNAPTAFKYIIDFAITRTSPKMGERVRVHTNIKQLHSKMDPACLPSTYGGPLDMQELINYTKQLVGDQRKKVLGLDDMELLSTKGIITSRNRGGTDISSVQGSFRKLEID